MYPVDNIYYTATTLPKNLFGLKGKLRRFKIIHSTKLFGKMFIKFITWRIRQRNDVEEALGKIKQESFMRSFKTIHNEI